MTTGRKLLVAAVAWFLLAGTAFAGYHFLHYTSRSAPFTPVPEKFDLNALPNGALYYFVAEQGPGNLAPGDSFASLLSQIKAAADTWSGVATSKLRVSFGGLSAPGVTQSTPSIQVLFEEVPPGIEAMAGPTTMANTVTADSGAFVPITQSVLILPNDLSQQPSSTDAFFMTAVHEMGHALGLQHTMTSSVMSTQVTRSTTRSQPLASDDEAALSWLYPVQDFAARTGSITGRVTLNGTGVHLASVVAMSPNGIAVSALADPDGVYRLAGLPPGQYYLYVHPLPPAVQPGLGPADVVLPLGPDGNPFPAGPVFRTQFYGGTQDILQAQVLPVQAGSSTEGVDFAVQGRAPLQVYGVTTYSFPGNYAVKPAFINVYGKRNFLVASGNGLTANGSPAPGLGVNVVGGSAVVPDGGVQAYAPAPAFLQVGFQFNPFSAVGPRHLIFSQNGDLYVLPAALHLVEKQPPSIGSATPFTAADGTSSARIIGTGFSATTRILFDGLPAPVASLDSSDPSNEVLVVTPPVGEAGHTAVVTALETDGQDSLFLDAAAPPGYTYGPAAPGQITIAPQALPAGSEAMVEVTGINTHFVQDQTILGFGSSDLLVRRVWVLSPTHLMANVRVSPSAQVGATRITVVTGLEVVSQPAAFQVQAGSPNALVANPTLLNAVTNLPSIYAGGPALLNVSNLPSAPGAITLTLNNEPATGVSAVQGGILFTVPSDLSTGPAVLRLQVASGVVAPIVVQIDPPPPVVLAVFSAPNVAADASNPAVPGQVLVVEVAGLADAGILQTPGRLVVTVGGVDHVPASVSRSQANPDVLLFQFTLSSTVAAGTSVPLTVRIDDRLSAPFPIVVVPAK